MIDANDNVYVFLPFGKVASASKSSTWTDWAIVYDGVGDGLAAFGEVTLDKSRIAAEKIVGMFYQKTSSGTAPSAVALVEFKLLG